ncbi:MAG: sugar phosphate isomerase/epimerase family protein [Planctomycetota bacterium]
MLYSGLVSITFRKLSVERVVELAGEAGVSGIEWGGDVHAPHGDLSAAREVRKLTRDAGLSVAAYGSYYRAGHNDPPFEAVLASAREMGAPLIRVWAGRRGSGDADEAYRRQVARDSVRIADEAAGAGMNVAYEFHAGTLTDTTESTRRLLADADHPNVQCYWQPPRGADLATCRGGLEAVGNRLAHVHAFTWTAEGERLPLGEGRGTWPPLLDDIAAVPGDRYVLVEFVRGDAPEQFLDDAKTLNDWLARFS